MARVRNDGSQQDLGGSDRNQDQGADRTGAPREGAQRNRNNTVDAAVELSERGGINPETPDPAEHHDRTRDRSVDEETIGGG